MVNKLTEARFQFLAGVITESEYSNQISEEATPDAVAQAVGAELKDFAGELEDALQNATETENEGLITTASLVLALPAVLGLIAKVGKFASSMINKMLGNKPNEDAEAQEYFKQVGAVADQLHHLYIKPIEYVVKKFVKDANKAHTISNAIFHVIIATMCLASGVTAIKALQAKNVSLASLESALTAVKSGEVRDYLQKLFV